MFEFLDRMRAVKPRWEHDCSDCTWLGPLNSADLYACITGYGPDNLKIETVIARYGPEGEYRSGLEFIDKDAALGSAYNRATSYILQVQYNAQRKPDDVPDAAQMNAFNLWEGAAFMTAGRVYIVHRFTDFGAAERVLVETHRGDDPDDETIQPFLFDYMDKVAIIGNVRNPQDFDDNDWGS